MEQNRQTAEKQTAVQAGSGNVPARRNSAQQNTAQEIDYIELLFVLLHNWKLLLLGLIMGGLLLWGYHTLFVKPTYRASTELYITNSDSVISLQDLQLGSALTEDYKTIITSRTVLNRVIEELQLDVSYRQLRGLISVSNPTGTHIITTSVTTNDRDSCRIIANELLNVSIERLYQVIGTSEPTIIDYSEVEAVDNVTPSRRSYIMRGMLFGVFLMAALIILRVLLDTTLKNDDDIEKYLKLPVLSAVPYFEED